MYTTVQPRDIGTVNIYRLSRTGHYNFDDYDSFVCIAASETAARGTHPGGKDEPWNGAKWVKDPAADSWDNDPDWNWPAPDTLECQCIGTATEGQPAGVVVASYNAG